MAETPLSQPPKFNKIRPDSAAPRTSTFILQTHDLNTSTFILQTHDLNRPSALGDLSPSRRITALAACSGPGAGPPRLASRSSSGSPSLATRALVLAAAARTGLPLALHLPHPPHPKPALPPPVQPRAIAAQMRWSAALLGPLLRLKWLAAVPDL
eukprot:536899-Rhodomonas_salina.1